MYNFFAEEARRDGCYFITGSDYNHIKNVLRMKEGDTLLISEGGRSHLCRLLRFEGEAAVAEVTEEDYRSTELPVRIVLFQGLPKSDKMELIIQKAVELGAAEIIPVEMNRCVVRLDVKKKKERISRWQSIAESAAKQSKRNVIPCVGDVMTYRQAMDAAKAMELFLVPYESKNGMADTREAMAQIRAGMTVGILIGPEGGFEQAEVSAALEAGGVAVSLGKRILRTETAAITAVGMCMLHTEMNVSEVAE